MCKPGTHIKLCTCAEEEIDESRCWSIFRDDPNSDEKWLGTIEPPIFSNIEMYMEQKLLEDLNNKDVFDFNYEAKNVPSLKTDETSELFGALGYIFDVDLYKKTKAN